LNVDGPAAIAASWNQGTILHPNHFDITNTYTIDSTENPEEFVDDEYVDEHVNESVDQNMDQNMDQNANDENADDENVHFRESVSRHERELKHLEYLDSNNQKFQPEPIVEHKSLQFVSNYQQPTSVKQIEIVQLPITKAYSKAPVVVEPVVVKPSPPPSTIDLVFPYGNISFASYMKSRRPNTGKKSLPIQSKINPKLDTLSRYNSISLSRIKQERHELMQATCEFDASSITHVITNNLNAGDAQVFMVCVDDGSECKVALERACSAFKAYQSSHVSVTCKLFIVHAVTLYDGFHLDKSRLLLWDKHMQNMEDLGQKLVSEYANEAKQLLGASNPVAKVLISANPAHEAVLEFAYDQKVGNIFVGHASKELKCHNQAVGSFAMFLSSSNIGSVNICTGYSSPQLLVQRLMAEQSKQR
jgi:hypothetical protein